MINVKHLAERAELLRRARDYFDRRGFLEVQPPCLCRDVVVDVYLDPLTIPVTQLGVNTDGLSDEYFLQTSPESAMKRMLVAGAPSIYSVGPVFRSGESGDHHNVEFTMLEWYERGGDAESAIKLLGDFVVEMLSPKTNVQTFDRVTYRDLFQQTVGIDPISASYGQVADLVDTTGQSSKDDLLDILLSHRIAPALGTERPIVVTDYPLSQAALAKTSSSDPECAARFELFYRGLELANGYDELLDPNILEERATRNNEKRMLCGRPPLTVDTTLLQAMKEGLPECSGVALGFDRLLMCMIGTTHIENVIPLTIRDA